MTPFRQRKLLLASAASGFSTTKSGVQMRDRRSGQLRRGRAKLALGAVCAAAVLPLMTPIPAAAAELSSEVTAYSDTSYGDGDGIRTPDIISTSASNVVVAWREGRTNDQFDNGEIRYSRSTDGGMTWGPMTVMAPKDATYGWHYVILYRVGSDLYAFLGRAAADSRTGTPVTNLMKKSTDGGATWSNFATDFSTIPAGFVVAGRPLFYKGEHVVPFWNGGKVAVMRSTNLQSWTAGAYAPDPLATASGENQLFVNQDDPNKLTMLSRVDAPAETYLSSPVYMSTTSSTNSGSTWTPLAYDPNIPNMGTKNFVTKDSLGRYLAVYNTMGGKFPSPLDSRPAHWRGILNYKVKEPGRAWGAGRFLTDSPPQVARPHSAGWDTYPMGDEYAPGKYFLVWESDTSAVKVTKLDLNQTFTGINEDWNALGTWSATPGASVSGSRVALSNGDSTPARISRATAPAAGYIAAFSGRITAGGAINTTTGVGANLATEVGNGTYKLEASVQPDGLYAKTSAQWTRVHTFKPGTGDHQYRITVTAAGRARLYVDSVDTGAEWNVPSSTDRVSALYTSGTSTTPTASSVDWFSVEDNVTSTTFDTLTGWTPYGSGGTITADKQLEITSGADTQNAVTAATSVNCDLTVDFRGQVTDYAALDPATGKGSSLTLSATNKSRRLMLAVQSDGVYTIKKGQTSWSRIYPLASAGQLASWRVDTSSGGEAKLFRNGVDTGARWTIQDNNSDPGVRLWAAGNNGDTAAFRMDWLRTTCNIR